MPATLNRVLVLALGTGACLGAAGYGGDRPGPELPKAVVRLYEDSPRTAVVCPGDGLLVPVARVRVPATLRLRTGSYVPQSRTDTRTDLDDPAPGVRIRPCFVPRRSADPAARSVKVSAPCTLAVTGPGEWTLAVRADAARRTPASVTRMGAMRLVSGTVRSVRAAKAQGGGTASYATDDTRYDLHGVTTDVVVAPRVPIAVPGPRRTAAPGPDRVEVTDLRD